MRIVSTVIIIFVVLYGQNFYTKIGKYVYIVLFYILVVLNVLQYFFMAARSGVYYNHVMSVELILIYICSIQCG